MKKVATPPTPQRVLLVDDNKHGLVARKSVLEHAGYEVTACLDPEQALQHFQTASYDLVVTDYRMPNMDGKELIAKFRETAPEQLVILISGMVEVLGLNEKNTGANVVIAKTSTEVNHLLRAANKLLSPAKKPVRSVAKKKIAKTS